MELKLPKELHEAYAAANSHIDDALEVHNKVDQERARLLELPKEAIIEELLKLKFDLGRRAVNVEELVYSILEDPKCAFLTYDMIESVISERKIPGVNTKAGNIRWYASKALEKERNVQPRVHRSIITRLLTRAVKG